MTIMNKCMPIMAMIVAGMMLFSCTKDENNGANNNGQDNNGHGGNGTIEGVIVTTNPVTDITYNSATCGGSVTCDSAIIVTGRGVCWSSSHNPTITGVAYFSEDGAGTGNFVSNIADIYPASTYYVRAYATTSNGTAYGNEVTFTTPVPENVLNAVFKVSATRKVLFSKGNLQYSNTGTHEVAQNPSAPIHGTPTLAGTWRIASNQWDIIGEGNNGASSTSTGWIDLFAWGTSGFHDGNDPYNTRYNPYSRGFTQVNIDYNTYGYGPSTNMSSADLTGSSAFYDWGVYNAISNGGNRPGIWRVLTGSEWTYLCNLRTTSSGIRYAKANVNNVDGLVVVPDNWDASTYTFNSPNTPTASYSSNVISAQQWSAIQEAGVLFLPAAGDFHTGTYGNNGVNGNGHLGTYWSSTHSGPNEAYSFMFSNNYLDYQSNANERHYGYSVRLVMDAQ